MKNRKKLLIPCVAALTLSATITSMGATITMGDSNQTATTGWQNEAGTWRYYIYEGEVAYDVWKSSGNHWFWLDEDGEMAYDTLVEYNDNYYYVNEAGARVTNEWRYLETEDYDDTFGSMCWYYFGSDGRAYKASSSGSTSFKTIVGADGVSNRYAFDSEGRMLFGWLDEESQILTDDDAWMQGTYYCGEDGVLRSNQWAHLEVVDDDNEDYMFTGSHWFYFGSTGKKVTDGIKTINGLKYRFTENGDAMFNWYTPTSTDSNAMYYNEPTQCWQSDGWFQAVPSEEIDEEAYNSDALHWFYATSSGELLKSQIKSINGSYYGFDENGMMLEGLYKLVVDGTTITDILGKIEDESDLPTENTDEYGVYYFGDSPKDGALRMGTATIVIDGESYAYNFRKASGERGEGYEGIYDDSIYIEGRKLKADSYEKLEVVEYEGEEYLINTSGAIQKNKKNSKDADGRYYCTDSMGIVIHSSYDKCTESH